MRMLRKLYKILLPDPPKLQEFYFRKALDELGIHDGQVVIQHETGRCFHEQTGWLNLTFPITHVRAAMQLRAPKTSETFFRGVITEQRVWVNNFENVEPSDYGRDKKKKYTFHAEYFEELSKARFGLAPVGDCPWSYRFFEAIMCNAIPVLGPEDEDIYASQFHHYRYPEIGSYDTRLCRENTRVLIENHTISSDLQRSLLLELAT